MKKRSEDNIDLNPAKEIIQSFPNRPTEEDIIPMLQELQNKYGYLSKVVLFWVSKETKIPISKIYGVITFYAQFTLIPQGKHKVCCCRGTACHVKGGAKVIKTVEDKLNITHGQTTEDNLFTLETVACLGACAMAPIIVLDKVYYGNLSSYEVVKMIDEKTKGDE